MKDFEIHFYPPGYGRLCTIHGKDIVRDSADGAGTPLYHAPFTCEDGRRGVVNLGSDWTIRSAFFE